MPNNYAWTSAQHDKVAGRPRISASLALDKGLWQGRKVAVLWITRGDLRHRTVRRFCYGTLDLTAGSADQIGVVQPSGEVVILHKSRAVDIYDMTRPARVRS